MPFAAFTARVHAPVERLWALLLDKIEHPERYVPGVEHVEILERGPTGTVRRMRTAQFEVVERITADEARREIAFVLVDHPHFAGHVLNSVTERASGDLDLTFTLDWRPRTAAGQEEDLLPAIREAVLHTKALAERQHP